MDHAHVAGMINAHVRDAAAVIGFAAEMEEILLGEHNKSFHIVITEFNIITLPFFYRWFCLRFWRSAH